jgi:ribosome biogenesis GTPase / thiamine phosphate phosphatase
MSLQSLGWNARLETLFVPHKDRGLEPARVAREDRGRYTVLDESGARSAELAGRLRHDARTRAELPAVGDWVALRPGAASSAVIDALLPRASAFVRKVAGETTEEQVVAANVDAVFLVCGLDGDFNPRRIERYLAAAWESGAEPVVVLNKADLADDLDALTAEAGSVAPGAAVVPVSALRGDGLAGLEPWLTPGRTVALLGSSGAGKSTLVNALLGAPRQATGGVREDDSRGRHTTTHRELVPLPGGALLLDTPGMRELQLWGGEESLDGAFPEIAELAVRCRFRDCRHESEPGCAVLAAAESGELDEVRLASWRKLQRELLRLAARTDAKARAELQAKWKAIHKSMRDHPKANRWKQR